jgi:hypothetical protein
MALNQLAKSSVESILSDTEVSESVLDGPLAEIDPEPFAAPKSSVTDPADTTADPSSDSMWDDFDNTGGNSGLPEADSTADVSSDSMWAELDGFAEEAGEFVAADPEVLLLLAG